uniref:NIPSNAP domain-containing protein n=1 Tax=Chromera velia CCMP2878 TaxID=1169474 RepID=A0A0G4HEW4_9ALVE|mmetsp:Transcript_28883/g.56549  ORF Transcript_28883/g.56549 Transcript_28883/m.56549 type:complete len:242 (-) Transcript_28883:138-863(-)|eukprot:Cvel_6605.t1-p1 / transcript=Cvel_6605.t1 / gene=Cvel_6605 / organism=Chromera_velia_CCMP2878 / gene_product=Protein NipSnap homolog 3A, putative / transcript_product=Protein NipSnap homolog 3A, putative / location=Cvel_scaffold326:88534-91922(+) / protein_length=241 / sequence_SO=supercontig / SO=protein_coding / is_pseudo=false
MSTPSPAVSALRACTGILEVRTYDIFPKDVSAYLTCCRNSAQTRRRHQPGWLFYGTAETGYGTLGDLVHLYAFQSLTDRAEGRKALGSDPEWKKFLQDSRPCLKSQGSEIFRPSNLDIPGVQYWPEVAPSPQAVYEIRHYQLRTGYDAVPRLLDAYRGGIEDKIRADEAGDGKLMLVAHSDIGTLNQVLEVWRYSSLEGSLKVREASRKSEKWKQAISKAAELALSFKNRILIPTDLSPTQ